MNEQKPDNTSNWNYFDSLLNDEAMTVNYHEIVYYHELAEEPEDMIVWIANEFNKRIKTVKHAARARLFMHLLVDDILEENAQMWSECEDDNLAVECHEAVTKDLSHDTEKDLILVAELPDGSISVGSDL